MGNRPKILYKSLEAWQEKGGETEKEFVGGPGPQCSQTRLAGCRGLGLGPAKAFWPENYDRVPSGQS